MNFVIWTARIAVMLYLVGLGLRISRRLPKLSQVVWTVGFLVFLVHVWAAFEFVHDWSHAAAWKHTAEQTDRLTGWYWGGGIWFNYLFTLIWGIDIVMSWTTMKQTKWIMLLHVYLGFIVVNATVVFGPPWWIPVLLISGAIFARQAWTIYQDRSFRIRSHD